MTTQKDVRSEKVKGLLTELNRFSSGVWQLSLMFIALSLLSKITFHLFGIPQNFQFVYIFGSALCGVFAGWCYSYGRPLILRHRAKKLLLFVNRGNAERVLHLGHELGLCPGNEYGIYRLPELKKLIERCPAKEFAEFLCSLLYLKSLEELKRDDAYCGEDPTKEASRFLFSNPERGRGLAECIVSLCEESYHFSPRKYISEFLDGLYSARHMALANNFIQAIDTALEKKRDTRIAHSLELKKSRADTRVERREGREQKFFNKTVGSLTK